MNSLGSSPGLRGTLRLRGPECSLFLAPPALEWIEHCSREHGRCRIGSRAPIPNRIIDVGRGEAYLHESKGEIAPYVALSHCWEDSKPLTTTKLTKARRKGRLIWDELPLAFREAIQIVRSLGIRFLWIDSLCIVQDDPEEWQLEAARMSSIFENAEVTLALHQRGPNESSLPRVIDSYDLPLAADGLESAINCRLVQGSEHLKAVEILESSKLSTRGWCFQVSTYEPVTPS